MKWTQVEGLLLEFNVYDFLTAWLLLFSFSKCTCDFSIKITTITINSSFHAILNIRFFPIAVLNCVASIVWIWGISKVRKGLKLMIHEISLWRAATDDRMILSECWCYFHLRRQTLTSELIGNGFQRNRTSL